MQVKLETFETNSHLVEVLDDLEHKEFLKKFNKKSKKGKSRKPAKSFKTVELSAKEKKDFILKADTSIFDINDKLDLDGPIAVDTEGTGLRSYLKDEVFSVSLCDIHFNSWYAQWPVDPFTRKVKYSENRSFIFLQNILGEENLTKIIHNANHDIPALEKMNIEAKGRIEDTTFSSKVLNTDEPEWIGQKLKPLCQKYCNLSTDDEEAVKKIVAKLVRNARKLGFKLFQDYDDVDSKGNHKAKAEQNYWLCQYAHILLTDKKEIELALRCVETYCRRDSIRAMSLYLFNEERFKHDEARRKTYAFEMYSLYPVIREMGSHGVLVNKNFALIDRERCLNVKEKTLKDIINYSGGKVVNPNSSKQLIAYLYGKKPAGLGLACTKETKTGNKSSDYKALMPYMYHDFVRMLVKYKAHSQAVTLFFDSYLRIFQECKQFPGYYVIFPKINQLRAKTTRESMNDPNLQQVSNPESSVKGANVVQVRTAFRPRPGYLWALHDFSGFELRIFGALSNCKRIIEAAQNGRDIPTEIADATWGGKKPAAIKQARLALEIDNGTPSSPEVEKVWREEGLFDIIKEKLSDAKKNEITEKVFKHVANYAITKFESILGKKICRTRSKNCMYARLFGGGVNGVMAFIYGATENEAKEWLHDIDQSMPEISIFMQECIDFASKKGYIETCYGRKIDINERRFLYRACNYKIQGSAADILKISKARVNKYFKQTELDAKLLIPVHDEIISEIWENHFYKFLLKGIKERMEYHPVLSVPMQVELSIVNKSWDKEIKEKDWYAKN